MAKKESPADRHGNNTISSDANGAEVAQGIGLCQPTPKNMATKFLQKVIGRIDLEALTDTLAEQITQRLFERINIEALVEQVLDKYGEDLQDGITTSILQSL